MFEGRYDFAAQNVRKSASVRQREKRPNEPESGSAMCASTPRVGNISNEMTGDNENLSISGDFHATAGFRGATDGIQLVFAAPWALEFARRKGVAWKTCNQIAAAASICMSAMDSHR